MIRMRKSIQLDNCLKENLPERKLYCPVCTKGYVHKLAFRLFILPKKYITSCSLASNTFYYLNTDVSDIQNIRPKSNERVRLDIR